jgi:hypothetical protein
MGPEFASPGEIDEGATALVSLKLYHFVRRPVMGQSLAPGVQAALRAYSGGG